MLPGLCIRTIDRKWNDQFREQHACVPQLLRSCAYYEAMPTTKLCLLRSRVQISLGLLTQTSTADHALIELLLLFTVKSVLPQTRAILLNAKLLSARLSPDRIVVVAALFAHEKNRFSFLLTSGHREGSVCRLTWAIWKIRVAIIAVEGLFRQVEMARLATFLGSASRKTLRMTV